MPNINVVKNSSNSKLKYLIIGCIGVFISLVFFCIVILFFSVLKDGMGDVANFEEPKPLSSTLKTSSLQITFPEAKYVGKEEFNDFCSIPNDGKLVLVRMKIKNIGKDAEKPTRPELVDDKKLPSMENYKTPFFCNKVDTVFDESISPGFEKEYEMYYVVPNEAQGLRLRLRLGINTEYILLGI